MALHYTKYKMTRLYAKVVLEVLAQRTLGCTFQDRPLFPNRIFFESESYGMKFAIQLKELLKG